MANPILTILFDVFVVGMTVALFAAAVAQARLERRGVVTAPRHFRRPAARRPMTRNAVRTARVRGRLAA